MGEEELKQSHVQFPSFPHLSLKAKKETGAWVGMALGMVERAWLQARGWRQSISPNEICCEVMRRTVLQVCSIPLRFDSADPGLLTKINSIIPGRWSGQKLVFAEVSAVFATERTNMPDKRNVPGWPSGSNQLIAPFTDYIYLVLGIYSALMCIYE